MHTLLTLRTPKILLTLAFVCIGFLFFTFSAHAGLFTDNIANDLNTLDQSGDKEEGTEVFSSGNFSVDYCSSGDCNTSFYSNGDGTYSTITTDNNSSSNSGYSQGSYNSGPVPVVTLYVTNVTAGTAETKNDSKIGIEDEIKLRWVSSNSPTRCVASASPTDSDFTTGNKVKGTDSSVTEPLPGKTRTFTVTCSNANGSGSDSLQVVRKPLPPVTTLFVTNATLDSTSETKGDIAIAIGDTIWLRWKAANYPTSCTASAVPADLKFSTGEGKEVKGTDKTVTEPAVGTATTYSVRCRNESGAHTDSLTVSKYPAPVTSLFITNTTKGSPETQSDSTIAATDAFRLRWSATNNPASCTGSASPADSSFSTGGAVASSDGSITGPAAGSSRDYTVTCQNRSGSSADTLRVTRATPAVCTLDGVTIPSGSSRVFYTSESVTYGTTCQSTTRTCTDGVLSGGSQYDESSCTVNPPGACVLDGVTVPHGSSRTFYVDETVSYGTTCQSTSRTCTNGVLSGSSSYGQTGCTVLPRAPLSSNDLNITANPSTVRYGESSTITWTSRNADSCTVTGPNLSSTLLNSSQTVSNFTSESVYTLRCTGGGTSQEKSVTVKVLPSSQET